MSTSLIQPEGQEDLLPPTDLMMRALEAEGEFTGARFFSARPDDYKRAVALLARGWGVLKVSEAIKEATGRGVSKNTIRAVRVREGQTIDLLRQSLGAQAYELAEDALEAARIIIDEIMSDKWRRRDLTMSDVQRLLVTAGIGVEKGQLLTGEATGRIAHELAKPEHDDFNAYLASLKNAAPGTGSAVDISGPKGLPPAMPPDSQSDGKSP